MKRTIKLGAIGIWIALGAAQAIASSITDYPRTTNYLVENVTFTLTGYVSNNGVAVPVALPTKQFIAFLSGVTNQITVVSGTSYPTNISTFSNVTVLVTNCWLLPTNDFATNFGYSYVYVGDYGVTPDNGVTYYTNNIDFTNDVAMERSIENGVVSYAFNNAVAVSNGQTAYLLTNLPASYLTAAFVTNGGTNTVFALSGSVPTNVPSSGVNYTTNYTTNTTPLFTNYPDAKLLYVIPTVSFYTNYPTGTSTNKHGKTTVVKTNAFSGVIGYPLGPVLPPKFVVRYTSGKTNVDTDVSYFFPPPSSSSYPSTQENLGFATEVIAFTEIDFNNYAGTVFSFYGYDIQLWGPLIYNGNEICISSVLRQRQMTAEGAGQIGRLAQQNTVSNAPTVVTGTIFIGNGYIE